MEALAQPQYPVTVRVFNHHYPATPQGARLARRVGLHKLHAWGVPYLSDASESAALIIGELAANAATHGRVPAATSPCGSPTCPAGRKRLAFCGSRCPTPGASAGRRAPVRSRLRMTAPTVVAGC